MTLECSTWPSIDPQPPLGLQGDPQHLSWLPSLFLMIILDVWQLNKGSVFKKFRTWPERLNGPFFLLKLYVINKAKNISILLWEYTYPGFESGNVNVILHGCQRGWTYILKSFIGGFCLSLPHLGLKESVAEHTFLCWVA